MVFASVFRVGLTAIALALSAGLATASVTEKVGGGNIPTAPALETTALAAPKKPGEPVRATTSLSGDVTLAGEAVEKLCADRPDAALCGGGAQDG